MPVPAHPIADGIAAAELERHRPELTGYCYRMLGSVFDAEDAVQETMLRGWRAADRFEGRSAVRTWLFRIATNVCLDLLRGRPRRDRPMDLGPDSPAEAALLGSRLTGHPWVSPMPDAAVRSDDDPADRAVAVESIQLAFVAALQHLPARQRAVLILRDVLCWSAVEVAGLLDTSVAVVNSASQRARTTLAERDTGDPRPGALGVEQRALLDRYVDAFERYDVTRLVTLLRDDVVQSMPPYAMWLRGPERIGRWMLGAGIDCRGSRLVPTAANGCPAYGQYRAVNGGYQPWALQVIEISGGAIAGIHCFLDGDLFPVFGLPARLRPARF